jgi:hypothetical protein
VVVSGNRIAVEVKELTPRLEISAEKGGRILPIAGGSQGRAALVRE